MQLSLCSNVTSTCSKGHQIFRPVKIIQIAMIFFFQIRDKIIQYQLNQIRVTVPQINIIKKNNFLIIPTGPPRLPVFGAYLFLLAANYRHLHCAIDRFCRHYKTTLLGFYYGPVPLIVCNDVDTVKEALNNPDLDGRPNLLLAQLREPNFNLRGIFFIEGDAWREQRRFILRHLRDFGFGRRFDDLELMINDELQTLFNMLKLGPKYAHEQAFLRAAVDGGSSASTTAALCPTVFYGILCNSFLKVLCNAPIPRLEQAALYK